MYEDLISIIIPNYNGSKYLKECLIRILNQTYQNIEVILVDDGSTDNSLTICEEYVKKHDNFKIIKQKNNGVSVARNNGIKHSKGKWITFIDSDDLVENFYCESLINAAYINKTDMVIGRAVSFYENGKINNDGFKGETINIFETNEEKEKLFKSVFVDNTTEIKYPHVSTCWGKLIRRDILTKNHIYFDNKLSLYEDALFIMNCIKYSTKIIFIDNIIYKYRLHNLSVTKQFNIDIIDKYDIVYKCFNEYFLKNPEFNYVKYDNYFKIKNLNSIIINLCNNKNLYSNKIRFIKKICNLSTYLKAIKNVKIKGLPKRRKVLVLLARLRIYWLIYILYKI